jgi:hypothetical protein
LAVLELAIDAGAVLAIVADAGINCCLGHSSDYALLAFIWKITAVESKSALAAKQWIQRIVVGTIGVEVASSLVTILTDSVPASPTH